MCAVCCSEGIVHIYIGVCSELFCKFPGLLLLFRSFNLVLC